MLLQRRFEHVKESQPCFNSCNKHGVICKTPAEISFAYFTASITMAASDNYELLVRLVARWYYATERCKSIYASLDVSAVVRHDVVTF